MANIKSSKKRIKINHRNRLNNKFYQTSTKTLIKLFKKKLKSFSNSNDFLDKKTAQTILNFIYSFLDKGTKKNVFHKKTAARKKSNFSLLLQLA